MSLSEIESLSANETHAIDSGLDSNPTQTAAFFTHGKQIPNAKTFSPCIYCNGKHSPIRCEKVTVFAMKICGIINALSQYLFTSTALNKTIIRRNGILKFYSSIKFTSTTL